MLIKRGLLQSFNPSTYTASVLLLEATSTYLQGVPVSTALDGTSAISGAYCALLFFDEQNTQDAVVLAVYPNGTFGAPTPPPGRVTFVTGYQQINGVNITACSTQTFTLTGGGSGIPSGASGIVYKAFITSPTAGAFIQLAPHGASDITAYASCGNIEVASAYVNCTGLLQIDSQGRIDIRANTGACTVTLYTHGYIV